MIAAADIGAAYFASCLDELRAPKAGNVHDFAAGHGMTVGQFELSADVTSGWIARPGAPVGARILGAIRATRRAVDCNTNLGIVLLCAPLAAAAERAPPGGLRDALRSVLDGLDVADAAAAFEAIVLAAPAGLGEAPADDVRRPAAVTLLSAMRSAAERDRIAWNYSHAFADVFDLGLPRFRQAMRRWGDRLWATAAVHFAMMAAFPDTHIRREHGPAAASAAQDDARRIDAALQGSERPAELLGDILSLDARLKTTGCNPGTSADLTVATLFAERLDGILRAKANDG